MQPPPVQYAQTVDGLNIAYGVSGDGEPVLFLPVSYSHVQLNWQHSYFVPSRRLILEALVCRFQLIQFDYRGEGMSSRGLTHFEITDFVRDLEAVVDRLRPHNLILYAAGGTVHTAVRFAIKHPDLIRALIFTSSSPSQSSLAPSFYREVASENWEYFIESQLARGLEPNDVRLGIETLKQTTTRDDYLLKARAWTISDVSDFLPQLRVPCLVLHPRDFLLHPVEESMRLSAQIPGSRMTIIDGNSVYGDAEQAMQAVESFLAELPNASPAESDIAGLSNRELEVLRLIAAGKSNQQVADELVISRNTVFRHVSNIFAKIGAANRTEAAVFAREHGIA